MTQEQEEHDENVASRPERWPLKKLLFTIALAAVTIVLIGTSYVFAVSPSAIRKPQVDHFHFRMQIIVNGQAVDFSKPPFQQAYAKGQCSGALPDQPFHFHDQKDQFVHVHWKNMTGGLLLKYYGWNFIGGNSGILGYRLDNLPHVQAVPIHGHALPNQPKDVQYWVYVGDEKGYQKRSLDDFKNQKLETFFGKKSELNTAASGGVLAWLFPKASAHGLEAEGSGLDEEGLERLNNLLGNVVIFVQKDGPSAAQIKAKFAHLEPLSESVCGG